MTIRNFWDMNPEQKAKCQLLGISVQKRVGDNYWYVVRIDRGVAAVLVKKVPNLHSRSVESFVCKFESVDEAITCACNFLAGEHANVRWYP